MNWAGVQRLPVVFVLENNQYAYSTPVDKQFAVDPVQRAAAYGFAGVTVDGNDAEAMFEATLAARERAVAGGGPTLIEAVTMRMHGHAAHDDMKYVPARAGGGVARARSDRAPGEAAARARRRRRGGARRGDRRDRGGRRRGAGRPDADRPTTSWTGVFCTGEAEPLGDGRAPWSGFAAALEAEAMPDGRR